MHVEGSKHIGPHLHTHTNSMYKGSMLKCDAYTKSWVVIRQPGKDQPCGGLSQGAMEQCDWTHAASVRSLRN